MLIVGDRKYLLSAPPPCRTGGVRKLTPKRTGHFLYNYSVIIYIMVKYLIWTYYKLFGHDTNISEFERNFYLFIGLLMEGFGICKNNIYTSFAGSAFIVMGYNGFNPLYDQIFSKNSNEIEDQVDMENVEL